MSAPPRSGAPVAPRPSRPHGLRARRRPPSVGPAIAPPRPACGSVKRCGGCGVSREGLLLTERVFISTFCAMETRVGAQGEPVQGTTPDPHLVVTCQRCGYWWVEETYAASAPDACAAAWRPR